MKKTTCFVAGIVKGIIERNDGTRHFGSLMNYQGHLYNAKEAGMISVPEKGRPSITPRGTAWYKALSMKDLQDTRAYMWGKPDDHWVYDDKEAS